MENSVAQEDVSRRKLSAINARVRGVDDPIGFPKISAVTIGLI